MAFSIKIKTDDVASFYYICFLCHIKYRHNISIIVKTYNDPIAGCEGKVEKWGIYVPRIKYIVGGIRYKVLVTI
jgi:hypothetical protein